MDEPDGVVVVATQLDDEIVAMASAGPSRDQDAPTGWELYAVNVLATHHGSGVADELLASVIAQRPATLWVVTDNARAQAFYRRHGFTVEGANRTRATGVPEIRMVRRNGNASNASNARHAGLACPP